MNGRFGRVGGLAWTISCFALVIAARGTAWGADQANPPPGWLNELPTVDEVEKKIGGKDAQDTAIRQAAALGVLEDVIVVFTGKRAPDQLAQMPPPAEARYRQYFDAASRIYRGPKAPVWNLSYASDFRREVLATTMTPSSQQAYWKVRTGTMVASQQRSAADARTAGAKTAWPSAEHVESDLKGDGERDTAARTYAALKWLGIMNAGRGTEYASARDRIVDEISATCRMDKNCNDRFYFCRTAYESSPTFLRALLDRYFAGTEPPTSPNSRGKVWDKAVAIPSGAVPTITPASRSCLTDGQFTWSDWGAELKAIESAEAAARDQRAKEEAERAAAAAHRAQVAEARERRRARAPSIAEERRLALADGQRAKGHTDMDVFGVVLGSVLTLPDCEDVGMPEGNNTLAGILSEDTLVEAHLMVASKTCLRVKSDGSTTILWGDGVLPPWAAWVTMELRDDVAVSAEIQFPQPAGMAINMTRRLWNGTMYYDTGFAARKRVADEAAAMKVPARAAKERRELEAKYGRPTQAVRASHQTVIGDTIECEESAWVLPGLHVQYRACPYFDGLLIEVDSAFKARQENERKENAANHKL